MLTDTLVVPFARLLGVLALVPDVDVAPVAVYAEVSVSELVSVDGLDSKGASTLILKPLPEAATVAVPAEPPGCVEPKVVKSVLAVSVPAEPMLMTQVCVTVALNCTFPVAAKAWAGRTANDAVTCSPFCPRL